MRMFQSITSSCWSRTIAQNMSEHKACRKTRAFCKPPIHKRLHTCTSSRGPSQLLIQVLTQCAFRDWFPMWSDPRYFSIPQPITSTTNSSAANFWIGHRLIGATPSHDHRTVFPRHRATPLCWKQTFASSTNVWHQCNPIQTISWKINLHMISIDFASFSLWFTQRNRIAHSPCECCTSGCLTFNAMKPESLLPYRCL